MEFIPNFQLNVRNIATALSRPMRAFGAIRFDPNNDCNVHCVYCHNDRSPELIDPQDFRTFVASRVSSVSLFQVGCAMEPTLDARLCDFLEIVAASPARPSQHFSLQTNGILLHRHDPDRLRRAELTHLSVSVDSAQPATHGDLRGGTSLAKVERNLRRFRASCPLVSLTFLTTVTSANLAGLRELMLLGLDIGVRQFVFRQMFYRTGSPNVDHARMPALLVPEAEFAALRARLETEFAGRVSLMFLGEATLVSNAESTLADSEVSVARHRRAMKTVVNP